MIWHAGSALYKCYTNVLCSLGPIIRLCEVETLRMLPKLKHTTSSSLSDHDILSRERGVIVDQVQNQLIIIIIYSSYRGRV